MKRIIDGKMYNTETGILLGNWSNGYAYGDFNYCSEELYKTKKRAYFIYGTGGAMSKYSVSCGQNCWSGSSKIIAISEEEAREWAEEKLDGEEYITAFGEVEEA